MTFPICYLESYDFILYDNVENCQCTKTYKLYEYFNNIYIENILQNIPDFKKILSKNLNIEIVDFTLLNTYHTCYDVEHLTPMKYLPESSCSTDLHSVFLLWEKSWSARKNKTLAPGNPPEILYLKIYISFYK